MVIDEDTLYAWGAIAKKYQKNDILFYEGDAANYYYQIISGEVRMYHCNEDGKEFNQGFFTDGCSFGEPPLFIDENYPSNAMAQTETIILKLSKNKFLNLLEEYPSLKTKFLKLLSNRIFNKAASSKQIINQNPESRIKNYFENYKRQHQLDQKEKILFPYTRQQIADFTGLRVETVIRAIKKMEKAKILDILHHKIYI